MYATAWSSYAAGRQPGNVLGLRWRRGDSVTSVSPKLLRQAVADIERQDGRHPPPAVSPRHGWEGGRPLSLASDFSRRRRGPDTTLRFKRSASPGPLFRVGITKKPRGKATLINLSFPLVPFPHAGGVGPYTTLRFKRSASPGPLFRVGRNRGIFSVRTLLESGHANHSV